MEDGNSIRGHRLFTEGYRLRFTISTVVHQVGCGPDFRSCTDSGRVVLLAIDMAIRRVMRHVASRAVADKKSPSNNMDGCGAFVRSQKETQTAVLVQRCFDGGETLKGINARRKRGGGASLIVCRRVMGGTWRRVVCIALTD